MLQLCCCVIFWCLLICFFDVNICRCEGGYILVGSSSTYEHMGVSVVTFLRLVDINKLRACVSSIY